MLVSCSSSSSSMQGLMSRSPGMRDWLLYMCRLRGPSSVDEGGPPATWGPPLIAVFIDAARLKGLEWSNSDTAMDALVLAPGANGEAALLIVDQGQGHKTLPSLIKQYRKDRK